ncbi:MAG: 30S ribosomal protein S4 [Spirochaetes bacterium]|nr:30S ribosomal protein S4 [Spirochaetota bacterium]
MARNRSPKGKVVRRFGANIFGNPKYDRLLKKKPYGPGKSSLRRKKQSVYGQQLNEKQKMKLMYGVLERQFRRYFEIANQKKGVTGENLIQILETRLDNIVYRMRFASTRSQARQLVLHKHVEVNGKIAGIPSYQVKIGDVISVKEKSKNLKIVLESLKMAGSQGIYPWLEVDVDNKSGTVKQIPRKSEVTDLKDVNEQLVVELYSK